MFVPVARVPTGAAPSGPSCRRSLHSIQCSACSLQDLCLAEGLNVADLHRLDSLVATRIKVKRGQALFKAGDAFDSIYPIRVGFFKSRVVAPDGREQTIGFPMPGDILGFDAIGTGAFQSDAVALDDAEVCVIPFNTLETLCRDFPPLQQRMNRVFSREIVRDQGVMLLLGTLRAEERVAAFLHNLSERFLQRGFSPREFVLRMTREEIGSYLGLKLETVSRSMSRLQDDSIIRVDQKRMQILDPVRLRETARCTG